MIASTDYIRAFAEQIRAHVPGGYKVLGTDGFGRSDYRRKLRSFFEVDRNFVAVAALKALADAQLLPAKKVADAIELYQIDPEKCVGCGACRRKCPVECIAGKPKEVHLIDQGRCIKCGQCFAACKFDAVKRT